MPVPVAVPGGAQLPVLALGRAPLPARELKIALTTGSREAGAGEVEVVDMDNIVGSEAPVPPTVGTTRDAKLVMIKRSFRGYEDDVRTRLKMDSDNRPKTSLWVSRYIQCRV